MNVSVTDLPVTDSRYRLASRMIEFPPTVPPVDHLVPMGIPSSASPWSQLRSRDQIEAKIKASKCGYQHGLWQGATSTIHLWTTSILSILHARKIWRSKCDSIGRAKQSHAHAIFWQRCRRSRRMIISRLKTQLPASKPKIHTYHHSPHYVHEPN